MTSLFGFDRGPEQDLEICDCGHSPQFIPDSPTPGYAWMPGGTTACYDCAYKVERREFLDLRTRFFIGYISTEMFYVKDSPNKDAPRWRVTNWAGRHLAWVWFKNKTRRTCRFGDPFHTVYATDEEGGCWTGLGQMGLYIKLRRLKSMSRPLPADMCYTKKKETASNGQKADP